MKETLHIAAGDFAYLRVKALEKIGAFLDQGKDKDLFLPFSEQTRGLKVGDWVAVGIYRDKADRLTASMKVEKFLSRDAGEFRLEEEVELFIFDETDLGFKAVINSGHLGVLYRNEVFQPLKVGDRVTGYIQQIRSDGKIDLRLQRSGHQDADEIGQRILDRVRAAGGFLAVGDKTSADKISLLFGVSKKKFKMALGGLYKRGLVTLSDEGVTLVKKDESGT